MTSRLTLIVEGAAQAHNEEIIFAFAVYPEAKGANPIVAHTLSERCPGNQCGKQRSLFSVRDELQTKAKGDFRPPCLVPVCKERYFFFPPPFFFEPPFFFAAMFSILPFPFFMDLRFEFKKNRSC